MRKKLYKNNKKLEYTVQAWDPIVWDEVNYKKYEKYLNGSKIIYQKVNKCKDVDWDKKYYPMQYGLVNLNIEPEIGDLDDWVKTKFSDHCPTRIDFNL